MSNILFARIVGHCLRESAEIVPSQWVTDEATEFLSGYRPFGQGSLVVPKQMRLVWGLDVLAAAV